MRCRLRKRQDYSGTFTLLPASPHAIVTGSGTRGFPHAMVPRRQGGGMRRLADAITVAASLLVVGCGSGSLPTAPTNTNPFGSVALPPTPVPPTPVTPAAVTVSTLTFT